jgi:hypothetical protein
MSPDLLDTFARARQASASVSEPSSESASVQTPVGERGEPPVEPVDASAPTGFERSAELFCALVQWAAGEQARSLEHAELEARLAEGGRELIRVLLQEHLDLRADAEQRASGVVGADSVPRRNLERDLQSVFGEVEVRRLLSAARFGRGYFRTTGLAARSRGGIGVADRL